jgi:hypothetical protein
VARQYTRLLALIFGGSALASRPIRGFSTSLLQTRCKHREHAAQWTLAGVILVAIAWSERSLDSNFTGPDWRIVDLLE